MGVHLVYPKVIQRVVKMEPQKAVHLVHLKVILRVVLKVP